MYYFHSPNFSIPLSMLSFTGSLGNFVLLSFNHPRFTSHITLIHPTSCKNLIAFIHPSSPKLLYCSYSPNLSVTSYFSHSPILLVIFIRLSFTQPLGTIGTSCIALIHPTYCYSFMAPIHPSPLYLLYCSNSLVTMTIDSLLAIVG